MKNKDFFTKDLFDHKLQKGEKGYLEPGFHFDDKGQIVDDQGNIYDIGYNLVKEAPSQGLLLARKQHPDWSDRDLAPLAEIYQHRIEQVRKSKKEKQKSKLSA